jgi:hypothetical protein
LIVASYVSYRRGDYDMEMRFAATLVILMVMTVFYGILKLKQMQTSYDARSLQKEKAPK